MPQSTRSFHQVLAWKRSGKNSAPPVTSMPETEMPRQLAWCSGNGLYIRSCPGPQPDDAAGAGVPGAPGMEIFVAENAALRPPRGARGVEQGGLGGAVRRAVARPRRFRQPRREILQRDDRHPAFQAAADGPHI